MSFLASSSVQAILQAFENTDNCGMRTTMGSPALHQDVLMRNKLIWLEKRKGTENYQHIAQERLLKSGVV